MFYSLLKSFLFQFEPEYVHDKTFYLGRKIANVSCITSFLKWLYGTQTERLNICIKELSFSNNIGLAAGFDKNATIVPLLQSLGFGFIEVGTVTPKPQSGNPKPRLFRLLEDQAIINRMGFNNEGAEQLVTNLRKVDFQLPIGINIGKNKITSLENACQDYLHCLETCWNVASYFTINVSSPNTEKLRDLQNKTFLLPLLQEMIKKRNELSNQNPKKQIWLKIAPDLSNNEIETIVDIAFETQIDALIIANTTLERNQLKSSLQIEKGGLSGKPVFEQSNKILSFVSKLTQGNIPLVGVGGVFNGKDAFQKITHGASLIQLYTSLIYYGPSIVKKISTELDQILKKEGVNNLKEIVGINIKY